MSVILLAMATSTSSYAQLLEDRNKLKTEKKKEGFILFKVKVKTGKPSGKHKTENARKARITKAHAGGGSATSINPRFSVANAGRFTGNSTNPRYSKTMAGQGADRRVFTRNTQDHAGANADKKIIPRYSQSMGGQDADRRVFTRYTQEHAGSNSDRRINPRFSTWSHVDRKTVINPRFSKAPSFSKTKSPYNKQQSFLAAFSRNNPEPKHLPGPYTDFTGKIRKLRRGKNMHPSANYLYARYNQTRVIRDTKRKVNVVWVRMYGNQLQPDAVKKKSKKSKFDKDELEIWNN